MPLSSLYGSGFNTSWVIMQAIQIADALPGGLNRANFILALRTMDMTQPTLLNGVKFNMDGNADAYPTEGSDISRWDGIVSYRASMHPPYERHENIATVSSHFGLGQHPAVLWAVADRLAQPEGTWRPFEPPTMLMPLFPPPPGPDD